MGMTVIYAILIFCLLIFVHEFGHFAVAKSVGIRVNEFALGMGPKLFHFKKGETEYTLRLLPIGGFCKMEGEDEESDDPRAFGNKAAWKRALVVVAGAVMNYATTVLIIIIIALSLGTATNIVDTTSAGLPAEQSGIKAGDRIISVNQTSTPEWEDVIASISGSKGETLAIVIERDGVELSVTSTVFVGEDGRRIIGITSRPERSVTGALVAGVSSTWSMAKEMVGYLGTLFTGGGSVEDLVGPVGIVSIINDQAKLGILYIANLTALISLNLAIVNLLPFPALDGGRLLFMLIRQLTGKRITDEIEAKIHFAGLMLLFGLMAFLVVQDVDRFIFR